MKWFVANLQSPTDLDEDLRDLPAESVDLANDRESDVRVDPGPQCLSAARRNRGPAR